MTKTPLTLLTAACTLALALALTGCGEGDETEQMQEQTQAEPGTAREETAAQETALDRAKAEAADAATKLQEVGVQAGAAARDAASSALDAVKAQAEETSASLKAAGEQASAAAAAAAKAASEQTNELTRSVSQRAETMITEVQDYLRENDLDSAQGVIDKLKGIRDQLSEDMRQEIDRLQERVSDETQSQSAG